MNKLLSKNLVDQHKEELKNSFLQFRDNGHIPKMVAVVCSTDPAVASYVGSKKRLAVELNVDLEVIFLSPDVGQSELMQIISTISDRQDVDGIVLELPVERGLDELALTNSIDCRKDVDGLTASNLGLLVQGATNRFICPATPLACLELARQGTSLVGKHAVVIGRGRTVGKPLANLLVASGATTTICNSNTVDLVKITNEADIVFLATGSPRAFGKKYFRTNQTIIDAGIGFIDGKICGDADITELADMDINITPVPGGVGPLTSVLLFGNLLTLMNAKHGKL